MACSTNNNTSCGSNGFVLVIVLYILLAIILSGAFTC
ncbi:MAG: sporulation protein YjcZ [Bacilli bacterium]|nr:sporulation protein YjcZ [Bacilli bacterium]